MSTVRFVVPGDALGGSASFAPGSGTRVVDGSIVSTLCGSATTLPAAAPGDLPTLIVTRPGRTDSVLPRVGSLVILRVTRVDDTEAGGEILVVDGVGLPFPAAGCVRREHAKPGPVDGVLLGECFRVGDLVRAVVVSLGTARAYLCSTAQDGCGVVAGVALDKAGVATPLLPVSDSLMATADGRSEKRVVARVEEVAIRV